MESIEERESLKEELSETIEDRESFKEEVSENDISFGSDSLKKDVEDNEVKPIVLNVINDIVDNIGWKKASDCPHSRWCICSLRERLNRMKKDIIEQRIKMTEVRIAAEQLTKSIQLTYETSRMLCEKSRILCNKNNV